ncbi:hypothetical protein G5V59_13090 [Nocardioides sp. W3-2-3]|uniref:divisome protein SepX/GlpR n=1 Tax=Nocardioides convexus TaxID=2712224 RepID=UPI002418891E|nr:hypothetical protein [Nocardioides convexus]NHA00646.1 hypothetical protein [Nocardioides convexus]
MDLSSLIFVALFVAWAVYLVPKALRSHEEETDSRSVEGFSDRLRVLARRDAVSASESVLVSGEMPAVVDEEPAAPTPAPRASRPARSVSAAQRRRRVLTFLLILNVALVALAVGKVAHPVWIGLSASLLAAWLVACRLMVRRERASRVAAVRKRRRTLAEEEIEAEDVASDVAEEPVALSDDTDEIPVVVAEVVDEVPVVGPAVEGWTPVPVTLPTYVAKAPAGRTVRTIDLDSTGVWSSGRNDADSQARPRGRRPARPGRRGRRRRATRLRLLTRLASYRSGNARP